VRARVRIVADAHSPHLYSDAYVRPAKKAKRAGDGVAMAVDAVPADADAGAGPYAVLYRAVSGSTKISTQVAAAQLATFNHAYLGVVRAQMTSLKKKDKSKRARAKKAPAAAASAPAAPAAPRTAPRS
jgi:hypothetical protein